ncbi:MAG TPA: tetratricopeptide repeat protein [Burkholderiales bacterium]|nr:tetratricopeptide repeat protein [Burkholderiales bacterium]
MLSITRVVVAALAMGLPLLAAPPVFADPWEDDLRSSPSSSDYAAGKKAVEAKQWKEAIRLLSKAAMQDDRNPDIQNFLGYAYRNAGEMDAAFRHYEAALRLNPRHRGAHEYVGEAYLLVDNLAKAEEHLAALEKICVVSCEELEDLKKAVTDYRQRRGRADR